MAKGYQILGFRLKTPQAEIDILARKGPILAVVEVKRRQSSELALMALGSDQRERLLIAGSRIVRTRPSLQRLEPRLDLIALSPGRLPHHLKGLTTTQGTAF
jgi:putative endonuclease